MGAVLAKFRKEKNTTEILENLEEEIQQLETFSLNTLEKQKRFVGNFLVTSIGVYIVGFLIFYFLFLPQTWMERITYSVPLLVFPLVIIVLRKALTWFFQRRLNKNSKKLKIIRAEKRKILEKVMDTETYKVALNLLNRFGDKSNGMKTTGALTPRPASQSQNVSLSGQRTPAVSSLNSSLATTPLQAQTTITGGQRQLAVSPYNQSQYSLRKRTPYPIINQQNKSVLEKMVDYLIGDGVQNRFAMICKDCYSHNGMALQEEFEYTTFRCAFCSALNPSRKARPIAPRLPLQYIVDKSLIDERKQTLSASSSSMSEDSDDDYDTLQRLVPKIIETNDNNSTEMKNDNDEVLRETNVEILPEIDTNKPDKDEEKVKEL